MIIANSLRKILKIVFLIFDSKKAKSLPCRNSKNTSQSGWEIIKILFISVLLLGVDKKKDW